MNLDKEIEDLLNGIKKYKVLEKIVNKNLWFVHSIDTLDNVNLKNEGRELYFNYSDFLDTKNLMSVPSRIEFNHSIGHLVRPFSARDIWDCHKYMFIAPMIEFMGELLGGNIGDYITVGNHKYSSESYLLVPNKELKSIQTNLPELKSTIVGYDYPEELINNKTKDQKRGIDCSNALKKILRNSNKTPPRQAVNDLFLKLREDGIDVYMRDERLQYANECTYEPRRGSFEPDVEDRPLKNILWDSDSLKNGLNTVKLNGQEEQIVKKIQYPMGKLKDTAGNLHNINLLIHKLYQIVDPDSSNIHNWSVKLSKVKEYIKDPKKIIDYDQLQVKLKQVLIDADQLNLTPNWGTGKEDIEEKGLNGALENVGGLPAYNNQMNIELNKYKNKIYEAEVFNIPKDSEAEEMVEQYTKITNNLEQIMNQAFFYTTDTQIIDVNQWGSFEDCNICSGFKKQNPIYDFLDLLLYYKADLKQLTNTYMRSDGKTNFKSEPMGLSKDTSKFLNKVLDKSYNMIIFCEIMAKLFKVHPDIIDYGNDLPKWLATNPKFSEVYWDVYLKSSGKTLLLQNLNNISGRVNALCNLVHTMEADWSKQADRNKFEFDSNIEKIKSIQEKHNKLLEDIVNKIAVEWKDLVFYNVDKISSRVATRLGHTRARTAQ